MSRLDRLSQIADEALCDVEMDDALKERVRQGIARAAQKRARRRMLVRRGAVSGLAAAACAALVFLYAPPPGTPAPPDGQPTVAQPQPGLAAARVTVSAQAEAQGGVAVSTSFLIETGDTGLTAQTLGQSLAITPSIGYDLTERGAGAFLLTPSAPLEKGTVYKIALHALSDGKEGEAALSWAFQTESENRVTATLPADGNAWAPLDTGIEITLTRTVADAEGYLTITPAAPGRLEYHGRTVVFVPTQPLLADTLYTVVLKAGLAAVTGEALAEDFSFSFRTQSAARDVPAFYVSGPVSEAVLPGDPVVVELAADRYDTQAAIAVTVDVYALDGEAYADMADAHARALHPTLGRAGDHPFDTGGLTLEARFDAEIVMANYRYYVVLPQTPAEGFYLIDIRARQPGGMATETLQKLVCVSSLSVWSQSLDGRMLVWANDTQTGQALDGAAVRAGADVQALCGSDGIAVMDLPDVGDAARYLPLSVTAQDGRQWRGRVPASPAREAGAEQTWQAFIYFDRAAYLPTDTLRYWGVVLARDGSGSLPDTLTLDWGGLLAAQPVALGPGGVFSGQISFEKLLSTYLHASLMVGEDTLIAAGLQVMAYSKPAYVLGLEADAPYYRQGETITVTAKASFFDGTPASGLALRFNWAEFQSTDAHGRAVRSIESITPDLYSWMPQSRYISADTLGQEDAYVLATTTPAVFYTDYMQTLTLVSDAEGQRLSAQTHQIDFSAVDGWIAQNPHDYYSSGFAEAVRGAAYDQTFTVTLVREEWVRSETGEVYDFINKQVRKTYTYDRVETRPATFSLRTEGGEALSAPIDYQPSPMVGYWLEVAYRTPDGAAITQTLYLSRSPGYFSSGSGYKWYYLHSPDGTMFDAQAAVSAILYESGAPAPAAGQMLYTVSQKSMLSWGLAGEGMLSLDCGPELLPNFILTAAYFDGRHIYPVAGLCYAYNPEGRALSITLTPDKSAYAPGETAEVGVTLRDAGQAPVEADFVLAVADEAAFAVAEQYPSVLGDLYRAIYHAAPATFASYVQHSMDSVAYAEEGGEGDAGGVRQNFADTAAFLTGRTGPDGTATVRFTVPDNLTAWRLTCAAVTPDGRAGLQTGRAVATLPFFINLVESGQYTVGDDLVLSARGAGTAVTGADRVRYQATLTGDTLSDSLSVQAAASDYAYFNFGKLPAGRYEVLVEAYCGQLADAMRVTLEVVGSRLEMAVSQVYDLSGLLGLSSRRYPVGLTFFDQAQSRWLGTVSELGGLNGRRADQRLARAAAEAMLEAVSPGSRPPRLGADDDLSGVQTYSGGLILLGHAQADAGLTADALAACPELIQTRPAVEFLYTVLYDRRSDARAVASAYLGLAAAGEPVLLELRALLGSEDALAWNLRLARGLALLGDRETALEWYTRRLAPALEQSGDVLYVQTTAAEDEGGHARMELTAEAAALAAALGHPDAGPLLAYVRQAGGLADHGLAALAAVRAMPAPAPQGESTLRYTLDGTPVSVTLSAEAPTHTILMDEAGLAAAGFEADTDRVRVLVRSVGGAEALGSAMPAGRAAVERQYEPLGDGRVAVRLSVSIRPDANPATDSLYAGRYDLADVLPSGLRFLSCEYIPGSGWYLAGEEDGRVSFALDTVLSADGQTPAVRDRFDIVYYARLALPGEFACEPAVLVHTATGGTAYSPRATLTLAP